MGKFYGVINGHSKEPRIFTEWSEAKKEVTGAKGALYKGFLTMAEAEEFIGMKKETESDDDGLTIYVDGSFELETGRYAYGMVVVSGSEEIHSEGYAMKGEFSSMRNVAGEVLGAIKAMEYAIRNGHKKLHLYFDYQGIESWAIGTWKRNNALTMGYHEHYRKLSGDLKVIFHKVKGHSGNRFNDRADEMAKLAFIKK